jgi:hypothetical protein
MSLLVRRVGHPARRPPGGRVLVGRTAMDEHASSFPCADHWLLHLSDFVGRICLRWSAM